ncbi:MAG: DegV family protein [Firmicutes bacterium]|nr:DegV family protein [Bacillota bacterium]
MVKFFAESTCDLHYETLDKYGISIIKMPFTLDGEEGYYDHLRDTKMIEGFFQSMRDGRVSKTHALNPTDYLGYWEPVLKEGHDVLYVSFSSVTSATFDSMRTAIAELKERYPERTITHVDTKGLSGVAGYTVLESVKMLNDGASVEEVVEFVLEFRERVKCYIAVADIIYAKRGGRVSLVKALIGSVLSLKPVLTIKEGRVVTHTAVRGRQNALKKTLELAEKDGIDFAYPVLVAHCCASREEIEFVKKLITDKFPKARIEESVIGPIIGTHTGPDTITFGYIQTRRGSQKELTIRNDTSWIK